MRHLLSLLLLTALSLLSSCFQIHDHNDHVKLYVGTQKPMRQINSGLRHYNSLLSIVVNKYISDTAAGCDPLMADSLQYYYDAMRGQMTEARSAMETSRRDG